MENGFTRQRQVQAHQAGVLAGGRNTGKGTVDSGHRFHLNQQADFIVSPRQGSAQPAPARRRVASEDQRRSPVSLWPGGRALFATLAPIHEARYACITEKFGYGKLELLYELLDELATRLDEDE